MLKKVIVATAALIALPALAGTQTWSFNGSQLSGNQITASAADGNTLRLTGWSDTGVNNTIETGTLGYSSEGKGVTFYEQSSPNEHSIDSFGNDFDMVLLSFDTEINLERFDIGWAKEGRSTGKADITVAAYTGAGNFAFNAADTWRTIADTNWSTIGHYGNVAAYNYQSVTTDVTSKYWLIGAYNPTFENAGVSTSVLGKGNDGFKLASVTGQTFTPTTTTNVPEPGTLAILASGLLGMFATRRREQAGL